MTEIEELTMYEYRALCEERNVTRWQYAALTNSTAGLREELAEMDAQVLADLVEGLAYKAAEYEVGSYPKEFIESAIAVIAEDVDRALNSVKFFGIHPLQDDSEPIATYETFLIRIPPRRRHSDDNSDSEPTDRRARRQRQRQRMTITSKKAAIDCRLKKELMSS